MKRTGYRPSGHRAPRRVLGALLALAALLAPPAYADCKFHPGSNAGTVTVNPPAQINVPPGAAVGTVLWASPMLSPSPVPQVQCNNNTPNSTGIAGAVQTLGGIPTFPTGNPAIGYQVALGDSGSWVPAYPNGQPLPMAQNFLSTPTLLRFVVLAPVASGSLGGGTLGYFDVAGMGHAVTLNLAHAVTFQAPACSVTTNPTHVTLPAVASGAFSGVSSTAGTTAFALRLNCVAGSLLAISLDTNSPATAAQGGVINGTSGAGYAQGIGVQILDQQGVPVTFGQPASVGTTPNGPLAVDYMARYYQTGTVSAGLVKATATFTLVYP